MAEVTETTPDVLSFSALEEPTQQLVEQVQATKCPVVIARDDTISVRAFVAMFCTLSVANTVKLKVPAVVGVPLRNPLAVSSVNPAGSWLPVAIDHR